MASAARQVTKGLTQLSRLTSQMSTLAGNASTAVAAGGNSQMAKALSGVSRALDDFSGGLSDVKELLEQMGFDTGMLQDGADTIQAGLGHLQDAAEQLRDATGDLETGMQWLERDGWLVSSTVQRFSDAIDTLKDASSGITDAMGQLRDTVRWLNDQDPISVPRPDSAMQDTTNTLFDAMDAMTGQMGTLNQNLKGVSDRMTNQVRAINDQIQVVTGLLLDAVQEISEPGSKTVLEDDSESSSDRTDGRIENCTNRGTVQADVDVGGIAGAIAVENLLDPEDDTLNDSGSLLRTGYSVSAVVDGCVNDGSVEAKKTAAGGIVGRMDLGLVQNCEAYGDVDGANQVGGIAGASGAKLLANWAKCRLSGANYVGGIVGEGTESRLTKGSSIVTDCRALVDILEADQYAGAISGGQTGDFSGNLFVSDSLRGIDRLSKAGQAEPTSYERLLAQENAPERFKQITVTFKDEDHVLGRVQLAYGDSLDEAGYPELPAKEGCAARWDTTELNNVHVDTVVQAVYTDYITALASTNEREDGRAVFFAKGQFGDRDSLTVSLQDAPAGLHNVAESWRVSIPDDGLETHTLRYLPLDTEQKYKVYALQDGSWKQLTTETIGSYLVFTVSGKEAELAIVHAAGVPVWVFVAAGAAVLALLGAVILRKKHRKKAKPAQAEENQTQDETT